MLATRLWVLPPSWSDERRLGRLWRLLGIALALLVCSSVMLLLNRTRVLSGRPLIDVVPMLPRMLTQTHFGGIWLLRPAALAWLGLGWALGRRNPRGRFIPALMLPAAVLIAFSRSATGHAADQGDFTLPEFMDWLHLLAAGVWGGGLLAVSLAVFPAAGREADAGPLPLAQMARRLSTVATTALAAVLATGIYLAWRELLAVPNLWRTAYGRVLDVKLLLVAGMMFLGAANRYIHVPRLQHWAGLPPPGEGPLRRMWKHFRRSDPQADTPPLPALIRTVGIETALLLGVPIAAAVLLHGMPPHDMPATVPDPANARRTISAPSGALAPYKGIRRSTFPAP